MRDSEPGEEPSEEPTALYEIRLQGAHVEPLRRQFPSATVFRTKAETVLFRPAAEPADLDALIDELLSMGLVLTEIHQLRVPQSAGETLVAPDGEDRTDDDRP
jgi:hypothetical protein